ncbi:MAG: ATP-dependent DNA helicase RecG [Akkermansiaceae bacterium]|nr:ATP-dependent DNA helicase RecG [Akkermansiaceae bacterium]
MMDDSAARALLLPGSPLHALPGIPPRELKALRAAGLHTVADVLHRVPRRYEDRRRTAPLASLANGDTVSLMLHAYSAGWRFSYKRYYEVSAGPADEPHGARLLLRWFNMPYVAKLLAVGMELSVYGKVREISGKWVMTNPDFEILEDEDAGRRLAAAALGAAAPPAAAAAGPPCVHTGRLVPIYRTPSGISARAFRALVWELLSRLEPGAAWEEFNIAPAYPICQALRDLHFPEDDATAHKARLRFALAECFERQFRVAWRRRCTLARPGQITATTDGYLQELLSSLPFELTAAQQRCVQEIRADMERPTPMNRLLQGDVGSGKTLVALCAMLLCVESGKTAALIAPTQILAEQHYNNFCRLLRGSDIRISLRTADRADDSALLLEDSSAAADTTPRILVGTHALLYAKNRPSSLGLAVIDEQHKFGVAQRERFISAGNNPDVLVMTATPIPRTLTLTFYGDLDVSIIDELPANRAGITTALRTPGQMKRIISFMEQELSAGRQVYIISPLIESSDTREQASATEEWQRWSRQFPQYPVGLLHGRMSAEEKDQAMAAFYANETRLLVATTVVEVGVDVPNATVMLINDADSFGLSQLHQLRGRIGRGGHKGWCILLSSARPGDPGREKLEALCRTTNGFEIAEEDFRLRGPGDVLGTAQSGLGAVQFTEWLTDARLIHRANRQAAAILDADPELTLPEHAPLKRWLQEEAPAGLTS